MKGISAFPQELLIKLWVHRGVNCAMYRSPFGTANGYVQDARLIGCDYYEDDFDVEAPHGITYGPDREGWIGFDTNHAGDFWTLEYVKEHYPKDRPFYDAYAVERKHPSPWRKVWTEDLVEEAVNKLADEVKKLSPVVSGKITWRVRE